MKMRVLQLFFVVAIYFLPVQTAISKEKLAEKFCEKLDYKYTSGTMLSENKKVANNRFNDECVSPFLSYVSKRGLPSEDEIEEFMKFCNNEIGDLRACSRVVYKLSDYGYTFSTSKQLLTELSTKRSIVRISVKWKDICLDYSLRAELLRIKNFNIDQCIFYFWGDKDHKEAIMRTYLTWLKTEKGHQRPVYCDCDLVFGLYSIYDGRKETDINVLYDYYYNVCSFEHIPGRAKWNKYNLQCIGESKEPLNGDNLRQFLSTSFPLLDAGWCSDGSTLVPFDDLWPKVRWASPDEIKYFSYALSANFNGNHEKKLTQILDAYGEDFVVKKCLNDIFEAAFKREILKFNGIIGIKRPYVWDFKEIKRNNPTADIDHPLNTHIEILLEIFKKTYSGTVTCEKFVPYLSKFKSILLQRYFSLESVTTNLSEFNKNGMGLDDLIQCYQFTLDMEDKIVNTYKILKLEDNWAYENEFYYYKFGLKEIRRLLFQKQPSKLKQICENQDADYNIKSLDGVLNILYSVFKDYDFSHLNIGEFFYKLFVKMQKTS